MTKFIEAVEAQMTGRKIIPTWPLEPISLEKTVHQIEYSTLYEYNIGLHWKVRFRCEQKDLGSAMRNVVRHLQEAVYGDLRERILRLDRAILEHDAEKARLEIRDLLLEINA